MKVIPIHEIRRREADPQKNIDASKRAQIIGERMDKSMHRVDALGQRALQATSWSQKFKFIREATTYLSKATEGQVPCKAKCNHCCHIPAMISQAEAEVIGKEIGVKPKSPMTQQHANMAYMGVPCPFLKQGQCSIYESRPIACRIHYNLDRDSILCRVDHGETVYVPFIDNKLFLIMVVQTLGEKEGLKQADIRDFF